MLRKYFENTRHYTCRDCGKDFTHNVLQWFWTIMHFDITCYRYVKCPHCGAKHWLQAKKVL